MLLPVTKPKEKKVCLLQLEKVICAFCFQLLTESLPELNTNEMSLSLEITSQLNFLIIFCSIYDSFNEFNLKYSILHFYLPNCHIYCYPVGIWCKNDIASTLMRRYHVASTLIRRHFTSCASVLESETLIVPISNSSKKLL